MLLTGDLDHGLPALDGALARAGVAAAGEGVQRVQHLDQSELSIEDRGHSPPITAHLGLPHGHPDLGEGAAGGLVLALRLADGLHPLVVAYEEYFFGVRHLA